ncbi:hypothetical protein ACFL0Q_01835 [Thermodesulfobacteriota bacterium]
MAELHDLVGIRIGTSTPRNRCDKGANIVKEWIEDPAEFEDYPEDSDENISEAEFEIPDVWWAKDIEKIEHPEMKQKEIQAAETIVEKEKAQLEKLESGKINKGQYDDEYEYGIREQKRRAATRSALESVGLTYDHLGDVAEDYDILIFGNLDLVEKKKSLKEAIDSMGPEAAQELADQMLKEGRISRMAHETISRQTRLYGK